MFNILFMRIGVESIIEETKTKQGPYRLKTIYILYNILYFLNYFQNNHFHHNPPVTLDIDLNLKL